MSGSRFDQQNAVDSLKARVVHLENRLDDISQAFDELVRGLRPIVNDWKERQTFKRLADEAEKVNFDGGTDDE